LSASVAVAAAAETEAGFSLNEPEEHAGTCFEAEGVADRTAFGKQRANNGQPAHFGLIGLDGIAYDSWIERRRHVGGGE
jgi:hypothetical protein